MNRREMLVVGGMGVVGYTTGVGFSAPACDKVSKDKAVRYAGLSINYLKDILPLAADLGSPEISELINRAIPLLEKLKSALEKADIPTAGNFFDAVTGILGQVANALFQLPESGTRNAIMAILTITNITLRTVQMFMEVAAPTTETGPRRSTGGPRKVSPTVEAIRKAFEATRF